MVLVVEAPLRCWIYGNYMIKCGPAQVIDFTTVGYEVFETHALQVGYEQCVLQINVTVSLFWTTKKQWNIENASCGQLGYMQFPGGKLITCFA